MPCLNCDREDRDYCGLCFALVEDSATEMLRLLEGIQHQLATDSDLDHISGADKYRRLDELCRQAITRAREALAQGATQ